MLLEHSLGLIPDLFNTKVGIGVACTVLHKNVVRPPTCHQRQTRRPCPGVRLVKGGTSLNTHFVCKVVKRSIAGENMARYVVQQLWPQSCQRQLPAHAYHAGQSAGRRRLSINHWRIGWRHANGHRFNTCWIQPLRNECHQAMHGAQRLVGKAGL